MINGRATGGLKAMEVRMVILRACVCGQANTGWDRCPACGTPAKVEDKGVVSSWHRNPLVRLWRKLFPKGGPS